MGLKGTGQPKVESGVFKMADDPEVTMWDFPLRWTVKSRSHPGESHLVDLGANDCIGACSCPWFTRTAIVDIRERRKPVRICHHIMISDIAFKKWAKQKFKDLDPNDEDVPPAF